MKKNNHISIIVPYLLIIITIFAIGLTGCQGDPDHLPQEGALQLTPDRLPLAVVGQPYSSAVKAKGGYAGHNYYWTTSGSLPPGLTSSVTSNDTLEITGTPTASGIYTFVIDVRDYYDHYTEQSRPIVVVDTLDISGKWLFDITITAAGGACSSEVGQKSSETIVITQTNTVTPGVFHLTLDEFLGVPGNVLTGQLTNWNTVQVSGQYPEQGGMTTSSYYLTVYSTNEMGGVEQWSWSGGGGECLGGRADIVATRIP